MSRTPIELRQLRPIAIETPEHLSNVDVYEIYVRITPVRYYELDTADGTVERAERGGETYMSAAYVARVHSKEAGAWAYVMRDLVRQMVTAFFGVEF